MLGLLLLYVPLAAVTGSVACWLWALKVNYDAVRGSGLPVEVLPFDSANPLWMLLDRPVTFFFARFAAFKDSSFTRFNWRGWDIRDRYKAFQERGDAIFFVTPGKNYLQLCDADAVSDVLSRAKDFDRPIETVAMLQIFGPNLGTAEGAQWQKHRRITASTFNEHVYRRVWAESLKQSLGMIAHWSSRSSIDAVPDDCRTVSLHVMSGAAFSQSYDWRPSSGEGISLENDDSQSYADALRTILDRCIMLLVLGQKNLSDKPWLPKTFRELHHAVLTFQRHMTKAYEHEKSVMARGGKQEHNLLTSLVRNSQSATGSADTGLTEQEVYGNIFVYNFAGHDATANSLAFGVYLMATRPEVQDWITGEINHVLTGIDSGSEDNSYVEVFPRLKRCLAVAHEVVRLYTAVGIAKVVGSQSQPLCIQGKDYMIPAGTWIIPSYAAMYTHPRYWGDDSLDFKPSRWIEDAPVSSSADAESASYLGACLEAERFKEPDKVNTPFIGWSGGMRNCPGRKFSQVEFVGVLVGLFRYHKVKPLLQPGESEQQGRLRLSEQIKSEAGFKLLLQILHPERLVLKWEKR